MDPENTTPPTAKTSARIAIITSIMIVIFIGGGVIYSLTNKGTAQIPEIISPTPTISVVLTSPTTPISFPSNIPSTQSPQDEGVLTYSSPRLEISFHYMPNDPLAANNVENIQVQETGNRIYLYPKSLPPDQGQFVEVFEKNKEESVDDAIKRLFLAGKDPARCAVTISNSPDYPSNFMKAEITDSSPSLDHIDENYCSKDYAQTNGARYFLVDSSNPTILLFFNIGQYTIAGGLDKTWQETVRIAN